MAHSKYQVGDLDNVLHKIFEFCELGTLKNCRAVNKQWLRASNSYLKLTLDACGTDEGKLEKFMSDVVYSSIPKIPNLQVTGRFPPILSSHSPATLKSLHLKNILFEDVLEFKRAIYRYFPNLEELILDGVHLVSNNNTICIQEGLQEVRNESLKKLVINRTEVDIFHWLGFDEMFGSFPCIKVFSYNETNLHSSSLTQELFAALNKQKIKLLKFSFVTSDFHLRSAEKRWPVEAMKSFIDRNGSDLEQISGNWGGNAAIIENVFMNHRVIKLVNLQVPLKSFSTFGIGLFENLTHVSTTTNQQNVSLFQCCSKLMPCLKSVDLLFERLTGEDDEGVPPDGEVYRHPFQICETVREVTLRNWRNGIHCCNHVFLTFSNVTKVKILEQHDDVMGLIGPSKVLLEEFLPLATYFWRNLASLKIMSPCGVASTNFEPKKFSRGYGNVLTHVLDSLLMFQELEVFEYSDSLEQIASSIVNQMAKGVATDAKNFDVDESIDTSRGEKSLRRVNKTLLSYHLLKRRVCFGTTDVWKLITLPKLRVLRLQMASVHYRQLGILRVRLPVFEVQNLKVTYA